MNEWNLSTSTFVLFLITKEDHFNQNEYEDWDLNQIDHWSIFQIFIITISINK
jgi:hypothetical protein